MYFLRMKSLLYNDGIVLKIRKLRFDLILLSKAVHLPILLVVLITSFRFGTWLRSTPWVSLAFSVHLWFDAVPWAFFGFHNADSVEDYRPVISLVFLQLDLSNVCSPLDPGFAPLAGTRGSNVCVSQDIPSEGT